MIKYIQEKQFQYHVQCAVKVNLILQHDYSVLKHKKRIQAPTKILCVNIC